MSSFQRLFYFGPIWNWFGFFLRAIISPIRRVSDFLLPLSIYDGLSIDSTTRASKQFTSYLKTQHLYNITDSCSSSSSSSGNIRGNDVVESFSTKSYSSLVADAMSSDALILVYLHSRNLRNADGICKRLLLSPSMARFLIENKQRVLPLGSFISTAQGASLSNSLSAASFPLLALLQPIKSKSSFSRSNSGTNNSNGDSAGGSVKLIFKAEGPALMKLSASQLTGLLMGTFQKHERTVLEERTRRYEREQDAELRRQQDAEYQETLRKDQERERQREEARLEAEREKQRKIDEEKRKIEEEANRLEHARSLMKDEPPKSAPGSTRIRLRLPNGKQLDRRFGGGETIGAVKGFLILHFASDSKRKDRIKNCVKRVGLSTIFPTRNFTDDDDKTLKECELCPQAVLMVTDLDA